MDISILLSVLAVGVLLGVLGTLRFARRHEHSVPFRGYCPTVDHEIRRRAAMLELVLDTIPVRVFWKDPQGRYLGCNRLFALDSGHQSSREVVGKTDREMPWSRDAEEYQLEDRKVLDSGTSLMNMERVRRTSSGERQWHRTSKVLLPGPGGETLGVLGIYEDITRRKEIEGCLREQEARMRMVLDSAGDGIITINCHGIIESFNRAATRLFGYSSREVIGLNVQCLMPEPFRERHDEHIERYIRTGVAHIIDHGRELRGRRKDGTEFPLFLTVSRIEIGGEFLFTGIIRDLTREKEKEAELLKLSSVVENNPNAIMITDLAGTIEYVNPQFVELTGYGVGDVVGRNPKILGSESDPEKYRHLWQTLKSGKIWRGEFFNRRKDGSHYWAGTTISPIVDREGKVIRYVGVSRDITRQKEDETRIREAESLKEKSDMLLMMSLESIRDGFAIFDKDGRLEIWNNAFHELHDKVAELIVAGTTYEDILRVAVERGQITKSAEYRDPLLEDRARRADRMVQTFEEEFSGNRWIRISESQMSDGSSVVVYSDITSLKIATAEAKAAARAKSEFLANMSHEIRTPMNAVIGLSHLCLQTQLTPRQQDYIQKVHNSATSLLRIINDILDFSKIEAGRLDMEAIEFTLDAVLDNMEAVMSLKAEEKNLRFLLLAAADIPPGLVGDPLRLGQVLINLVNNAIKFTEVGQVSVHVEVIDRGEHSVRLRFSVRDTGVGMSRQERERLFRPFSQADSSTTRRYGGTGLGLAISRRLIELMGGRIWAESESGRGSEFIFEVLLGISSKRVERNPVNALGPVVRVEAGASGSMPGCGCDVGATLSGARILLVEDNEINRQVARELLEQAQVTVLTAENGLAALEILEREVVDGVLMDVQMPVMDGITATRKIRADPRFKELPILAMTANAMADDREECLAVGMKEHIAKPVDPCEMLAKIARWIRPVHPGGARPENGLPEHKGLNEGMSLPEIPGMDTLGGLRRMGGNVAGYLGLLSKFCDNQRSACSAIESALAMADQETALRLAHTLKGVSATIGAVELTLAAGRLEKALRNGDEPAVYRPHLDLTSQRLEKSLGDIQRVLSRTKEDTVAVPVQAETPELIARRNDLLRLASRQLASYDAEVDHTLASLRDGLVNEALGSWMDRLERQVSRYDFEGAETTLNECLERLGIDRNIV
ncbi:MAG: PAS domain S-box protein [Magnetococcales bacterium]|nr:PAS domain S-box protein [Magnetococcales bacterium]